MNRVGFIGCVLCLAGVWLAFLGSMEAVFAEYPVTFQDALGRSVRIEAMPSRVVSVSPSVTEVLIALGAEDLLEGVTYHDAKVPGVKTPAPVGGFLRPSLKTIQACKPDLVLGSPLQEKHLASLRDAGVKVAFVEAKSLAGSYENIGLLGRVVGREAEAEGIVKSIQDRIDGIQQKVSRIPRDQRRRVMRLMGRDRIMAPGDDSFQNDMIRAAGGIPPCLGKAGDVVPVDLEAWKAFDAQVLYGCGMDRGASAEWLDRPGWRDVEAVRKGRIYSFPCELTCRAATHTGEFVAWLASRIYPEAFARKENQVYEEKILDQRPISVPLAYVREARIVRCRIHDFFSKTLILDFTEPQRVLSTLEGERQGIVSVGNHFSPPPCWALGHALGLEVLRKRIYHVIDREVKTASFLFTGADMDNLSVQVERFQDMSVTALVTAGVESNAVRMSRDTGRFYELGTINILLLTNTQLTPRAMSRAVISATEAKTAALQDLDIRSRERPLIHQATGTGTDNILVVEGRGPRIDNAGGHSKMGELMARAVYRGVQEAVFLQNGLRRERPVISRLDERGISPYALVAACPWAGDVRASRLERLEQVLLDPHYAAFVASALAVSDDAERGLIQDLTLFRAQCGLVAESLAGRPVEPLQDLVTAELPEPLALALNALLNGIAEEGK
jgi:ABC-type Fe3+-hydroxamate transport system substrate-binding protein/adenosylcobinamide amidohydrolase